MKGERERDSERERRDEKVEESQTKMRIHTRKKNIETRMGPIIHCHWNPLH